jgi:hypothetical protein
MPPYLLLRDDRCLQWSKFSSWLNWCAIRCRRWRAGGIAAASSASRAGAGVAGNAPVHDPETRASAADPAFLSIFLVKQALNAPCHAQTMGWLAMTFVALDFVK